MEPLAAIASGKENVYQKYKPSTGKQKLIRLFFLCFIESLLLLRILVIMTAKCFVVLSTVIFRRIVKMCNLSKKEPRKKAAYVFCIAAIIIILLCSVFFAINKNRPPVSERSGVSFRLDQNAAYLPVQERRSATEPSENTLQVPGYERIEVKNNFLYTVLENPAGNPCYFRFILTLDSGTLLLSSGLVPPGMALQTTPLLQSLHSGEYGAAIQIETFSLTDQTPMNSVTIHTVLTADSTEKEITK